MRSADRSSLTSCFHINLRSVPLDRTGAGSRASCDQLFWSFAFKKSYLAAYTRTASRGQVTTLSHPRHKIYESTEQVSSHYPNEGKYQADIRKAIWLLPVLHQVLCRRVDLLAQNDEDILRLYFSPVPSSMILWLEMTPLTGNFPPFCQSALSVSLGVLVSRFRA